MTLPHTGELAAGGLALDGLTRDGAREAVQEELRRREYVEAQPSLVTRFLREVGETLGDLLDRAAGVAPGGLLGALALAVLLGLFVAVVLARIGPLSRGSTAAPLFEGSRTLSATDHRRLAESAAAEGRFAEAVRERLRAVVRELELRGALDPRPGRTAGEVARDAGAAVPALAEDLSRATTLFDEIWYGGRPADASSYAVLVAVDDEVRAARLTAA